MPTNELRQVAREIDPSLSIAVNSSRHYAIRRYQGRLWTQLVVLRSQSEVATYLTGYRHGRGRT